MPGGRDTLSLSHGTGTFITLKAYDRRCHAALVRIETHHTSMSGGGVRREADWVGTNEIIRQAGKSKTCAQRWQERLSGLLRDKTRLARP